MENKSGNQVFSEMTEEEILGNHFDASMEIADTMREIVNMKRHIVKLTKILDEIDVEMEFRQSKQLRQENKLI